LPNNLKSLSCSDNLITELPKLPKSLSNLSCYGNKLIRLPELKELNNLKELNCSFNNLNEIPELPESLEKLECIGNNLPYKDLNGYWIWFHEYYPIHYPDKYNDYLARQEMKKYNL